MISQKVLSRGICDYPILEHHHEDIVGILLKQQRLILVDVAFGNVLLDLLIH